MTSEDEVPWPRDLPADPWHGIHREGLEIRVGSRHYIFEKDPETDEWLYVSFIPVPPDDEEIVPFDPSGYR